MEVVAENFMICSGNEPTRQTLSFTLLLRFLTTLKNQVGF